MIDDHHHSESGNLKKKKLSACWECHASVEVCSDPHQLSGSHLHCFKIKGKMNTSTLKIDWQIQIDFDSIRNYFFFWKCLSFEWKMKHRLRIVIALASITTFFYLVYPSNKQYQRPPVPKIYYNLMEERSLNSPPMAECTLGNPWIHHSIWNA